MRKIYPIPVIILLALAVGCSPLATPAIEENLPAPTVRTSPVPEETAPIDFDDPAIKGSKIILWHGLDGEMAKSLVAMVGEWELANDKGIKVEVRGFGNYYALGKALEELDSETEPPSLVLLLPWQAQHLGDKLADLTPFSGDPSQGIAPEVIPASLLQAGTVERMLPYAITMRVLVYNRSMANRLGFPSAPSTMEEFSKQLCAANDAWKLDDDLTNDGFGGWALDTGPNWQTPLSFILSNGSMTAVESEDGFASKEILNLFTQFENLRTSGCTWLPEEGSNMQQFAEGKALIYTSDLSAIQALPAAMAAAGNLDEWQILPYPGSTQSIAPVGLVLGISQEKPQAQKAAWLLMRWLIQPEQQQRWQEETGMLPVNTTTLSSLANNGTASPEVRQASKFALDGKVGRLVLLVGTDLELLSEGYYYFNRSYPYYPTEEMLDDLESQRKTFPK